MGFVGKSFFVQSGKECGKEFCSTKRGMEKYIKVITIKKCNLSMPLTALEQVLELNKQLLVLHFNIFVINGHSILMQLTVFTLSYLIVIEYY